MGSEPFQTVKIEDPHIKNYLVMGFHVAANLNTA